ncbi:hypothetical protein EDC01DRAFT_759137 [Geopyxis carbonaria]|nr:hypothetical protein EDC01DRAFT_759137 [Geopyxis carbonaria]
MPPNSLSNHARRVRLYILQNLASFWTSLGQCANLIFKLMPSPAMTNRPPSASASVSATMSTSDVQPCRITRTVSLPTISAAPSLASSRTAMVPDSHSVSPTLDQSKTLSPTLDQSKVLPPRTQEHLPIPSKNLPIDLKSFLYPLHPPRSVPASGLLDDFSALCDKFAAAVATGEKPAVLHAAWMMLAELDGLEKTHRSYKYTIEEWVADLREFVQRLQGGGEMGGERLCKPVRPLKVKMKRQERYWSAAEEEKTHRGFLARMRSASLF